MLLPAPSHNTPEGRAKLRREAEQETKAALEKQKIQEINRKRLRQQTIERNLKKLKSSLVPKVAKSEYLKREIVEYKKRKHVAEEQDKNLKQEQNEIKQHLTELEYVGNKLKARKNKIIAEATSARTDHDREVLKQNTQQVASTTLQKQLAEKTAEVDQLKSELLGKSNLDRVNKVKVQELLKIVKVKEKALQLKIKNATVNAVESKKIKNQHELLHAEVIDLKKQLQLKERELAALETKLRAVEVKENAESQSLRQEQVDLESVKNDLRQAEVLAIESGRSVGYLERKISEGNHLIKSLLAQQNQKFNTSQTKSVIHHRESDTLNKQAEAIELEIVKQVQDREELEKKIKSDQLLGANFSAELKSVVSKIRILEYEQTKLENDIKLINKQIEQLENELEHNQ